MSDASPFACSHPGCEDHLPGDHRAEIPPRWTVARVEEHGQSNVRIYYLYLCPKHALATTDRQQTLFPGDPPP